MQPIDILNSVPMIVDWPATWSKIELYNTCHWKFYLQEGSKFITGKAEIPFATNRPMELGNKKHALYESAARIWSGGPNYDDPGRTHYDIPEGIKTNPLWNPKIGNTLKQIISAFPHTSIEEKIGIDSTWANWKLGEYWNPDQVAFGNRKMLLRTKIDLVAYDVFGSPKEAVIIDYKSGKVRIPSSIGQLALYALAIFLKWPTVSTVSCAYIFVDHNTPHPEDYTRDQIPWLKSFFVEKILRIQRYLDAAQSKIPYNDASPGNCHWCAATREQCEHKG